MIAMPNPIYNLIFKSAHLNHESKRAFFTAVSSLAQTLFSYINQNTCHNLLDSKVRLKLVSKLILMSLRLCGLDFINIYYYLILTH